MQLELKGATKYRLSAILRAWFEKTRLLITQKLVVHKN